MQKAADTDELLEGERFAPGEAVVQRGFVDVGGCCYNGHC